MSRLNFSVGIDTQMARGGEFLGSVPLGEVLRRRRTPPVLWEKLSSWGDGPARAPAPASRSGGIMKCGIGSSWFFPALASLAAEE